MKMKPIVVWIVVKGSEWDVCNDGDWESECG